MTEPAYLAAVRESYDTVATDYAELVKSPADLDPLSRAMLAAFAELVRAADLGPVADLGCGPGKVTAHPADRIVALLERAGLVVTSRLLQGPDEGTRRTIATFPAHKPEPSSMP